MLHEHLEQLQAAKAPQPKQAPPTPVGAGWWVALSILIALLVWGTAAGSKRSASYSSGFSVPYSSNSGASYDRRLNKPPPASNGDVGVRGYYRSNGTYVRPHYRSRSDSTSSNNYSNRGNVNPYTGRRGYR